MTDTPVEAPTGLILMSEQDLNNFLPPDILDRMRAELSRLDIITEFDRATLDWESVFRQYDPEILYTAWSTPFLPEDLSFEGKRFKYLCHLPGGVRGRVTKRMIEEGLIVTNWGNSISRVVAECGLLLILACLRRVTHWSESIHHEGGWRTGWEGQTSLFHRTVGLHGFGRISQELARLLGPFDCRILALSPSVPDELMAEHGVERAADVDALFGESEIVVELAAMTERNRNTVKERHLRMLPETGAFVNVGRAGVVEEEGLLKVAQEGKLQIGLDVYHQEPLPLDSPLRSLRNVTLLPHIAGPTVDRMRDSGELALANLRSYKAGEPLEARISPRQYDSMT